RRFLPCCARTCPRLRRRNARDRWKPSEQREDSKRLRSNERQIPQHLRDASNRTGTVRAVKDAMPYKKKLIEVALPLAKINFEAAREKSIRHGHPSTLHL